MNRTNRSKVFGVGLIALLAALCVPSACPAGGHEISALYKVIDATDVGQEMRVTLQIRFVNNSDADLTVTKAALRSIWPGARDAEHEMSLLLRAHNNALLMQQFTVTRLEFEQWAKGIRPHLFLRLQTTDGREITRTLVLSSGQLAAMGVE